MRKFRFLIAVTGVACALSTAAYSADFDMKIALNDPPKPEGVKHYAHWPLMKFEEAVEERSGGRIDVKFFFNGQLGKGETIISLISQGLVEATSFSSAALAGYYADVEVLNIPYLFINRDVAYGVLDGPFGQKLADDIADATNIRPAAWLENGGYRNFTANTPIQSAADMKGLKIRTMSNPVDMAIVRALGASPTPISWADLYTALQTGVVDGQENSIPTFKAPHLYETQKYMVLDGHTYSALAILMSEKWLDSLPNDLRAIIMDEAKNMRALNRELSQKNEAEDRKYLEGKGMTIFDLTLEQKSEFRELTQEPAIASIKERVSPERLQDILHAVDIVEKKLGL